jgi:hydrogenase-4 component F
VGYLLPLVLVAPLTAALCLPLGRTPWGARISVAGAALLLALALALAGRVLAGGPVLAARGWLHADALAALLAAITGAVGLASAWYARSYMAHEEQGHDAAGWAAGRFEALFHLLLGSLVLAAVANNLGLLWIAIEASTLSSALLVGYYRRPGAVEAGWKYLILCSVGITLALFATVLLYYSGVGHFAARSAGLQWTVLRDLAPQLEPRFVRLAFLFALVGYGTKAGLAPMHTWLPDAHSQAPTPVSALLSAALLAVALGALLRFHALAVRCLGPAFSENLLVAFGLLSMAVAVPFLLIQSDYKRLLAYSSVEHTGFVVLAVGLGSPLALLGGLFHLATHALGKTLAFLVGGSLKSAMGTARMDRWSGVMESSAPLGVLFAVAGVALAGLPPLALFLSEWMVLIGGLRAGKTAAVIAALAMLAMVFAALAFHWTRMALGKPRADFRDPLPRDSHRPLWLLAALLLVLGAWFPAPLHRLLLEAASAIRGDAP